MRTYRIHQVDAFTTRRFEGNPAGVVLDALGLSDDEMQNIARELNNSETAFVLPPDAADHDLRVRYFTPTVEVPFCGHATVAAHYAHTLVEELPSHRVRQRSAAGRFEIDVTRQGDAILVEMRQRPPEFGPPLSDELRGRIMAACGGAFSDLRADCPTQVVSVGHSKVIVALTSPAALAALAPDAAALIALSREIGSNGFHLFAPDAAEPGVLTTCRMFAPAIGILEDPVTGNGNGALGAYLVQHHLVPHPATGAWRFRAAQGHATRRPGIADVTVLVEGGRPVRTIVGGAATLAFEGTLTL